MERTEQHVVIGAGIAGCLTAIMRRRAGYDVVLLEASGTDEPDVLPVCTQGSNIVSENHSGAEYPFDPQSARDCLTGRVENERFFPDLIFGGKTYSRIIASRAMQEGGQDIVGRCRSNLAVIRDHYRDLCDQDPANRVFGDPDDACADYDGPLSVDDVGAAFVTPQRGISSATVSAVLDWELRSAGVDVRPLSRVDDVSARPDGSFAVVYADADGAARTVVADQVAICAAGDAMALAGRLEPAFTPPQIFVALREILYVDLPDGTDKDYTCLKLEDAHGGMFSPMNQDCALIYHPPTAHIAVEAADPTTHEPPPSYRDHWARHPGDVAARAERTLTNLRRYYPELERSAVITPFLRTALNTVTDSRVRRNAGIFEVRPGCTAQVLLKWTMGVPNARRDLELALRRSVQQGTVTEDDAAHRLAAGTAPLWQDPPPWSRDAESLTRRVAQHAAAMGLPEAVARPLEPAATLPVAV